jgi:membrane-bound inhibitor of C-type lysozyme
MRKNTFWSIVALIIIVVGGYFAIKEHLFTNPAPASTATSTAATVINTVAYSCDAGRSIGAAYSQSAVALTLSDGRSLNLLQTMSGSGIRYEASATSTDGTMSDIVFSSEGDNASLMENASTTYQDCLAGTVTTGSGTNTFTNESKSFSFSYPSGMSVIGGGGGYTQDWMVNATTSGMVLAEIKLPQSYLPGSNFGDAKFTVGTSADPSALSTCLTYNPTGAPKFASSTVTISGTTYAVLQSSNPGAGNYYDTTSYRTERDSQCYAIEYTIHYANFQNFPKGKVTQFDEAALKSTLDSIVKSFTFLQ